MAERKAVYQQKVPAIFCTPAEDLNQSTQSCADNAVFLQEAEACLKKVENLHRRVAEELKGRTQVDILDQQNHSLQKGNATYEETYLSQEFMFAVTQLALNEIDAYFDYVVYPEHAETDEETMAESCFRDVVVPMDGVAEQLENKLRDIARGMEISETNSTTLKTDDRNFDSKTETAKKTAPRLAPNGAKTKKKKLIKSGISKPREPGER
jgi:hypothetical protein